jgi:hypothetical protein
MESKDVKILRISTGEDIVCGLVVLDGTYYLKNPMTFILKDTGKQFVMMMQNWLPIQIIANNEATLKEKDVITVITPEENFTEYYLSTVEDMEETLNAKIKLRALQESNIEGEENNEWMNILEDMELSKGQSIH